MLETHSCVDYFIILVSTFDLSILYFIHGSGKNCFRCFVPMFINEIVFSLILEVEPQYSGARIEGDVITLDFVKKMMDDFKNQKCLHKRYV